MLITNTLFNKTFTKLQEKHLLCQGVLNNTRLYFLNEEMLHLIKEQEYSLYMQP